VSLSWRDRLRVVLAPRRVILVRLGKGPGNRVSERKILACEPAPPGAPPWEPALAALAGELAGPAWRRSAARVILSNHFVHYLLVPWQEKVAGDEEQEALVRHRFTEVYGEAAADWELRWDEGRPPAPSLASAVDRRLLAGLQALFESLGMPIDAIEPYLMAAFNRWRRTMDGRQDWFLLAEPGRLCLAWFRDEAWAGLQCQQVGEDWGRELPRILERTLLLAGPEAAPGQVCIAAPETPAGKLTLAEGWSGNLLKLPDSPGFLAARDGDYAMAMNT